jgi:hypothetical protein
MILSLARRAIWRGQIWSGDWKAVRYVQPLAEIGKQYVTFNHWQAYLELVVKLRRRRCDECTYGF